ncbi:MAG: chorismate--pyruvate lyase [Lachnospiraceae bacterium]|nr:chorismate--pyruvate lyase [Lachnospiraceae bacterium]
MFERIDYVVRKIDGDYAYLEQIEHPEVELKCVARALLPENIEEHTKLSYEMMQYQVLK